jgi:hypothetical protein
MNTEIREKTIKAKTIAFCNRDKDKDWYEVYEFYGVAVIPEKLH